MNELFKSCIKRISADAAWLMITTCDQQIKVCCKWSQQHLKSSLQISSFNKFDFHKFDATWWSQHTCCNLLTTCCKPVKSTTFSRSVAFHCYLFTTGRAAPTSLMAVAPLALAALWHAIWKVIYQNIYDCLLRYLRYSIDKDKIRDQDSVTVVGYVAGNSVGRELAWKFLKENWDIFYKRYL